MDIAYLAAFFGGLLVFFGTHFYTAFRTRDGTGIADRMGRGAYMGLYSLLTVVGFVALVWGFAYMKPWIPIWDPPTWTRHITTTLMLPAVILIVAAYVRPTGYIKKAVRHPMLTAVKLWALAHLVANGDLASIILFSSFLIFGVVDRIAVKRRGDVGAANADANILGDMISVAVGSAVYGLFIYQLHEILFGAPILVG